MRLRTETVDVVIANGASLSAAAAIGGRSLLGLIVPTWTSAAISFQVSVDGVTYYDLYNSSAAEVSITAGTHNKAYAAPLELLLWPFVKIRAGVTGAGVAQGAERTITLVMGNQL